MVGLHVPHVCFALRKAHMHCHMLHSAHAWTWGGRRPVAICMPHVRCDAVAATRQAVSDASVVLVTVLQLACPTMTPSKLTSGPNWTPPI